MGRALCGIPSRIEEHGRPGAATGAVSTSLVGQGQSLSIGVTVLAACVLISWPGIAVPGAGNIRRLMEDGLIILGWVAY